MKTYQLYSVCCACAALLLAGCARPSGDTVAKPSDTSNDIGFGISSVSTKASNALMEVDGILSMGIFGYTTDYDVADPDVSSNLTTAPNLLYNQKATRPDVDNDGLADAGSEWTYSPPAYWPIDMTLRNTFFAYSPHTSDPRMNAYVSEPDHTGYPTITYTLPASTSESLYGSGDMVDLLYAVPVRNKNRESVVEVNDGKVIYEMKHALTWLSLVIATVQTTPNGVFESGEPETYTVDWLAFMAEELPVSSTLDLGTGKWSESDMTTDYRNYEFELNPQEVTDIPAGKTALAVDPANRLLLLPYPIEEKTEATIDITFRHNGIQYYYYIPFPPQRMTAGNVVVYALNISPVGITLEFVAENSIKDWDDDGKVDMELEVY